MAILKWFVIASLALMALWFGLGKTLRIPAFSFASKTVQIPAPCFAPPARKDVAALSAIHLVYFAVVVGWCLLLRESAAFADFLMSRADITPAQIGPFVAGVLFAVAAAAGFLLLLALRFTVRRAVAWFTVFCHSALVLCTCFYLRSLLAEMSSLQEFQARLTQCILLYTAALLAYSFVFFACTMIKKKIPRSV